jgi:hypothetical protein
VDLVQIIIGRSVAKCPENEIAPKHLRLKHLATFQPAIHDPIQKKLEGG